MGGGTAAVVLASVLGYCLVASVKPSLHTPLMSMSNAISGIVIIGGMYQIQGKWLWGGAGWGVDGNPNSEFSVGSVTLTQVLGAVAVRLRRRPWDRMSLYISKGGSSSAFVRSAAHV